MTRSVPALAALCTALAAGCASTPPPTPERGPGRWQREGDALVFRCEGLGASRAEATQMARASCHVLLCEAVGMEVSVRLQVHETLEHIDVRYDSSERCERMRATGLESHDDAQRLLHGGWRAQVEMRWPLASYEQEVERLAKPTVVEHHIVVQEGAEVFADPAACREALAAWGRVQGVSASELEQRRAHLAAAERSCSGIDPRDAGLFAELNTLLLQPLDRLARGGSRRDARWLFLVVPPPWRAALDGERFLVDRIRRVAALLDLALPPVRLVEATEDASAGADTLAELLRPLMRDYAFTPEPGSEHHRINPHELIDRLVDARRPYLPAYRAWLIEQARARPPRCYEAGAVRGNELLEYLGRPDERGQGGLDDEEWEVALHILRHNQRSHHLCFTELFPPGTPAELRARREAQVLTMIRAGEIPGRSPLDVYAAWLHVYENGERADAFLRDAASIPGDAEDRARLASDTAGRLASLPSGAERTAFCAALPRRIEGLRATGARLASGHPYLFCSCLDPELGVEGPPRAALSAMLDAERGVSCRWR